MKVLNFIQFFKLNTQEKREYLIRFGFLSDVLNDYNEHDLNCIYYKRLVTDFKPELITELFDGWIFNGLEQFANGYFRIDWIPLRDKIGYNNGGYIHYFVIPRTLDDFITDCQRAGIELQWKETK